MEGAAPSACCGFGSVPEIQSELEKLQCFAVELQLQILSVTQHNITATTAYRVLRAYILDVEKQHRNLCSCLHNVGVLHRDDLLGGWDAMNDKNFITAVLGEERIVEHIAAACGGFRGARMLSTLSKVCMSTLARIFVGLDEESLTPEGMSQGRGYWLSRGTTMRQLYMMQDVMRRLHSAPLLEWDAEGPGVEEGKAGDEGLGQAQREPPPVAACEEPAAGASVTRPDGSRSHTSGAGDASSPLIQDVWQDLNLLETLTRCLSPTSRQQFGGVARSCWECSDALGTINDFMAGQAAGLSGQTAAELQVSEASAPVARRGLEAERPGANAGPDGSMQEAAEVPGMQAAISDPAPEAAEACSTQAAASDPMAETIEAAEACSTQAAASDPMAETIEAAGLSGQTAAGPQVSEASAPVARQGLEAERPGANAGPDGSMQEAAEVPGMQAAEACSTQAAASDPMAETIEASAPVARQGLEAERLGANAGPDGSMQEAAEVPGMQADSAPVARRGLQAERPGANAGPDGSMQEAAEVPGMQAAIGDPAPEAAEACRTQAAASDHRADTVQACAVLVAHTASCPAALPAEHRASASPRPGRAAVLRPEERLPLSPPRLRPLSKSPAEGGEAANPASLKCGDKVRLQGLQRRPDLNGLQGKLAHYDQVASRWHVHLTNGEGVRIRAENLRPVGQAPVDTGQRTAPVGVPQRYGLLWRGSDQQLSHMLQTYMGRVLCCVDPGTRLALTASSTEVHAAVALHGRLYLCGGSSSSRLHRSMEAVDLATGTWHSLPSMSRERTGFSYSVLSGRLYIIGGIGGDLDRPQEVLGSVECYDPTARAWQPMPAMPMERGYSTVAVVGAGIYVAGGCLLKPDLEDADNSGSQEAAGRVPSAERFRALGTLECFDPAARVWQPLPSMGQPRFSAVGAAVDGRFYVAGGRETTDLRSIEMFDLTLEAWQLLLPMVHARASACGACLHGQFYVMGGVRAQEALRLVERYDLKKHTWKPVPSMSQPRCGAFAHAVPRDHCIHVSGGCDGSFSVESYNSRFNSWAALELPDHPEAFGGAAVVAGQLFIFGGSADTKVPCPVKWPDSSTSECSLLGSASAPRAGAAMVALPW